MEYDVIVVGARVAGAATAMLLARRGLRVLVLEQARFPSDTLSTHQIQLPGVACLARWGLLDKVIASNAPPTPGGGLRARIGAVGRPLSGVRGRRRGLQPTPLHP